MSRTEFRVPSEEQENKMLADVTRVEACLADPASPMYGSDCVPWVADLCCLVREMLSELTILRATVDEVQSKRVAAAEEGTYWKGMAQRSGSGLSGAKFEQATKGGLANIMGKWPGDETDEEIDRALEEMS